jgi:predicted double-glycine peptidase
MIQLLGLLNNKFVWLGLAGALAFGWYTYTNNKLNKQEALIESLDFKVKVSEANTEAYLNAIKETSNLIQKNAELLEQQRAQNIEVLKDIQEKQKIFDDHNLKNLASKKPGLIEKRVNRATIRVFEQIESETKDFYEKHS